MNGRAWPRADLERLFDLHRQYGPVWKGLVKYFPGRTPQQLAAAYNNHRDRVTGLLRKATAEEIVSAVLAARDRRADLSHRSLTGAVFGDPLPGRSALDNRLALSTPPAGCPASLET